MYKRTGETEIVVSFGEIVNAISMFDSAHFAHVAASRWLAARRCATRIGGFASGESDI